MKGGKRDWVIINSLRTNTLDTSSQSCRFTSAVKSNAGHGNPVLKTRKRWINGVFTSKCLCPQRKSSVGRYCSWHTDCWSPAPASVFFFINNEFVVIWWKNVIECTLWSSIQSEVTKCIDLVHWLPQIPLRAVVHYRKKMSCGFVF